MKAKLIYLAVLASLFAYYAVGALSKVRHGHSWAEP
jgi:hypothetical protein